MGKRKTLGIVAGILGVGALSLGIATDGFVNWSFGTQYEEKVEAGLGTEIEENGVQVKLLARTTADGYITDTYSFVITPENATNQNVTAVASYVDGTTYDNAVEVTVDNTAKTIQLKVSETVGFDKQIKVVVASESNPDVTATMTLDFTKRVIGVVNPTKLELGKGKYVDINTAYDESMTVNYTKYTIDKEFYVDFDLDDCRLGNPSFETTDVILNNLQGIFTEACDDRFEITADYIWNYDESNEWRSFLKSISNTAVSIGGEITGYSNVYEKGTGTKVYDSQLNSCEVQIYIGFDYSSAEFKVDVDSITLENSNIIF